MREIASAHGYYYIWYKQENRVSEILNLACQPILPKNKIMEEKIGPDHGKGTGH